jgi:hypothetical protein
MAMVVLELIVWLWFLMLETLFEKFNCPTCARYLRKAKKYLEIKIFWGAILLLYIEGYMDISLAVLANYKELHWETYNDWINLSLMTSLTPIVFLFPFICWYILHKNKDRLSHGRFQ